MRPLAMTDPIPLPAWLVAVGALLVLWSVLDRMLIPSTRWLLRHRANRIVEELNTRLQFRIPAFKLTRRRVLIDRLTSDPAVMQAVTDRAAETGLPMDVLREEVEHHAHEIVPSFNAYAYFRIGSYAARRVAQLLYRLRLGYADDESLSQINHDASVVFVMNHRSNMDYVIVAYMAASRTALSYAVGEWARVWPLRTLIQSLGAYFVRRNSQDPLYRRILARYVQMATEGGVVQAVYPEGRLTRDGRLQPFRLGLISYMLAAFDATSERDLVFVPVGVNYDRVLEDRSLLRTLDPDAPPRGRVFAITTLLKAVGHNLILIARQRWYRLGYACVNFGTPISMRNYMREQNLDFRALEPDERRLAVERFGSELRSAVAATIPVLPAALVATVLRRNGSRSLSGLEIRAGVQALIQDLEDRNVYVHVPRSDRDYAVTVGLRMLVLRHFVVESDGLYRVAPGEDAVLAYYANSIQHFLPDPADSMDGSSDGQPAPASRPE